MSLRDNELARRQEGRIELRPRPLRVQWELDGLNASDGYELRATFACSARALPEATERRMLEEVLLGSRYALSDEDVARHFQPGLHAAATKAAQKHSTPQWLEGELNPRMIEALRAAASAVAFDCGLELLPPYHLDLQSPMYQRQQLRAMQQSLAEKQAADQIGHVQRSAALLKQFQSIRDAAPDLSPGHVLEQISPTERGSMLQSLLLASAQKDGARDLWAVAGPSLVRIAASETLATPQLFQLSTALGPLRSVQPALVEGQHLLLIGARSGFLMVDPDRPGEPRLFHEDVGESALGFNRMVFWEKRHRFVGSHSGAGIVCWQADKTEAPESVLRLDRLGLRTSPLESNSQSAQQPGPRNVQVLDESSLVFSAGGTLFVTDLRDVHVLSTPSSSQIIAILPDDRRMIVVHEDGTICAMDRKSCEVTCLLRRSTRVRSAGALPWLGLNRLLVADEQGPLECIGFDDQLVTQYQSSHRGLRGVIGSNNLVAAISSDRQRLVLWQSWDGRQPLTEIYLTGLTRHRVADANFG